MNDLEEWIERGRKESFQIMLVCFDFEDKSYYPIYFYSEIEAEKYVKNIISESKCKLIQSYNL
jgi:HEPN domain-containing protein